MFRRHHFVLDREKEDWKGMNEEMKIEESGKSGHSINTLMDESAKLTLVFEQNAWKQQWFVDWLYFVWIDLPI